MGVPGVSPRVEAEKSRPLPTAPLVSVRWRTRDGLVGFFGSFDGERAVVSVLDLDLAPQPTVFAELHAAGPRNWIVLPGTFPAERHAGFGPPRVYIGEQAVHPEPVGATCEREERRAEDVEAVVHPGAGVDDAPPAPVLGRDSSHRFRTIA